MSLQPSEALAARSSERCCARRRLTALGAAAAVAALLLWLISDTPSAWVPSAAVRSRWSGVQQSLRTGAHVGLHRLRNRCGVQCRRRSGLPAAPIRSPTHEAGRPRHAAAVIKRKGAGRVVPGAPPAVPAAVATGNSAPAKPAQQQSHQQKQPEAAGPARHVPPAAAEARSKSGSGRRGGANTVPEPQRSAELQQAAPPLSMGGSSEAPAQVDEVPIRCAHI